MKSIKQYSTEELNRQIRSLDAAIEDYELYFDKPDEDIEQTKSGD